MRSATLPIVALAGLLAVQARGQERDHDPASATDGIVVEGSIEQRKRVIVGSRIPRVSLQANPGIAMGTSANGMTPDSGMDPFLKSRRIYSKECKATGASLSKAACTALAEAQAFFAKGNLAEASQRAAKVLQLDEATNEDAFVAQAFLYRVAESAGDWAARRAALNALVDLDFWSLDEKIRAERTLAAMALRAGDRAEALVRFERVIALDPADTQSLMNAAILSKEGGNSHRSKQLAGQAIDKMKQTGEAVPAGLMELAD